MPTIDRVYGLIFVIHTRGEHPPSHVHIRYNEFEATMNLLNGEVEEFFLPWTALKVAKRWVQNHREAALAEWERIEKLQKKSKEWKGKENGSFRVSRG